MISFIEICRRQDSGLLLDQTPHLNVTPHVSADDGDAYVPTTLELVFRNMRRYLAGEPLVDAARPESGY